MQIQTFGIVLSKLKYQDHSLIVKCYTKDFGLKSYLLPFVLKNKKGNVNSAYFQALSQLDYQAIHKNQNNLHKITEVKLKHNYTSLHTNLYKSTTVIFLSEVLSLLLIEEEANEELYSYLETALLWYDLNDFDPNFHLLFLLKLSKHLGCYPNESMINEYFYFKEKKEYINLLLGTNFDTLSNIKLNAQLRQEILNEILQYFSVHLGNFKQPKSLAVLHNVFK